MNDTAIDRALVAMAPVLDDDLAGLDVEGCVAALRLDIEASPRPAPMSSPASQPRQRHLTPLRLAVGAVVALIVVALISLLPADSSGPKGASEFAAAAVRVAEASPRLLVTAPGWSVDNADQFAPHRGETTFVNGDSRIKVSWGPSSEYDGVLRDARTDGSQASLGDLLGDGAETFQYPAANQPSFSTLIPPTHGSYANVRADGMSLTDYENVLASVTPVGVDEWLAAMPRSVVQPTQNAATVAEMLKGVPQPPGFDPADYGQDQRVLSRYQLGARVTGGIFCGWLDRWTAATEAGNAKEARQAVVALQGSNEWPVFKEMSLTGDYPKVARSYAEAIETGRFRWGQTKSGYLAIHKDLPRFRIAYNAGLGCRDLP